MDNNLTPATDEGNNITVTCEVTAISYPPPTIVWSRSNETLSNRVSVSDSVSIPTGNGNVTRVSVNLTITNASREDTGVYRCFANNTINSDSSDIKIVIQCKCKVYFNVILFLVFTVNPVIISETTDLSDKGRDRAIFTCVSMGEPVPDISWYFNDIMINVSDSSNKYMIVSRSLNITTIENTLTAYNITSSDVGVYTCTATNVVGNDTNNGKYDVFDC